MNQVRRLDRVTVRVDARALRNAQRVAQQTGVALTDLVDALVWSVVDSKPMEQLVEDAEKTSTEQAAKRQRRRRPADVIQIDRRRAATDPRSLATLRRHAMATREHAREVRQHARALCQEAEAVRGRADTALRSPGESLS